MDDATRFRQLRAGAKVGSADDVRILLSRTTGTDQRAAARIVAVRWDSGEILPEWMDQAQAAPATGYSEEDRAHAQALLDAARPTDVQRLAHSGALKPVGIGDGRDRRGLRHEDYSRGNGGRGIPPEAWDEIKEAHERKWKRWHAATGAPVISIDATPGVPDDAA